MYTLLLWRCVVARSFLSDAGRLLSRSHARQAAQVVKTTDVELRPPFVYLLPPYSQNGTVPSFWAKYGGLKEYLYSNRLCTPTEVGFRLPATLFCVIIMQKIARNLQIVGSSNFDPVAGIFHSLTAPLLLACSTNNIQRVAKLSAHEINEYSPIEIYRLQQWCNFR